MSPGGVYGAAAAGGLNPSHPNPVMQQYGQQQDRNMQQAEMIERVTARKQAAANAQLKASHDVLKDMLFGKNAVEDESTRGVLSKQYSQVLSQVTGMQLPQGVTNAWAKGGPSQASQKEVATILAGADASSDDDPLQKEMLVERAKNTYLSHGGNEKEWPIVQKTLTNPVYLESVNLPTKDKLAGQHADLETKQINNWASKHPEFKDTDKEKGVASWANQYSRRHFGKSIYEMNDANSQDAAQLQVAHDFARLQSAKSRMTEEQAALEKHKEQKRFDTDEAIRHDAAKAKMKGETPKSLLPAQVDKVLAPFNKIDTFATEAKALRSSWERAAEKGLLPSSTGIGSKLWAGGKRFLDPNDVDMLALRQLVAPITVGLIDRGLNDEKGSRAMKMFEEQVRLVRDNPTKEGYGRLFDLYEYLFGRLAQREIRKLDLQRGRIPDDVIDEAHNTVNSIYPTGFPTEPKWMTPKNPAPTTGAPGRGPLLAPGAPPLPPDEKR
jgi:hypothetical protein